MGVFDSVIFPCPKCGWDIEAQSKGADEPSMRVFHLSPTIPQDVIWDIRRHAPWQCENCKSLVDIKLTIIVSPPFVVDKASPSDE